MLKRLPGYGDSLTGTSSTMQDDVGTPITYRLGTDAVDSLKLHLVCFSDLERILLK